MGLHPMLPTCQRLLLCSLAVAVPELGAIVWRRSRLRELIALVCRPRYVLRGLAKDKATSSLTSRGKTKNALSMIIVHESVR